MNATSSSASPQVVPFDLASIGPILERVTQTASTGGTVNVIVNNTNNIHHDHSVNHGDTVHHGDVNHGNVTHGDTIHYGDDNNSSGTGKQNAQAPNEEDLLTVVEEGFKTIKQTIDEKFDNMNEKIDETLHEKFEGLHRAVQEEGSSIKETVRQQGEQSEATIRKAWCSNDVDNIQDLDACDETGTEYEK